MKDSAAIAISALAGALLPIQFLINARLGGGLGSSLWGATTSFVIGTVGLLAWILLTRQPAGNWSAASALPWWAWTGGLLGAVYVTTTIFTVPVLGASALVLLLILGQMTAGLLLDHFGILTAERPVTLARIAGLALAFTGTWLVIRS